MTNAAKIEKSKREIINFLKNIGNMPLDELKEKLDFYGEEEKKLERNGSKEVEDLLTKTRESLEKIRKRISRISRISRKVRKEKIWELYLAIIQKEDVKKIEKLLKAGVNPNAQDRFGRTLFFWVVDKGDIEVAKLFIKVKANVNLIDKEGRTLLDYAIFLKKFGEGNQEMISLLEASGAKTSMQFLLEGFIKAVGANINNIDENGKTILDLANNLRNKEMISSLKANGAKAGEELREEEKQKAAFERVGRPCDGGNKGPSR